MKILLDLRMASWSGVGRYSVGLARALAARDDVELLCVIACGDAPVVPSGPRVEFVPARAHPFSFGGMREMGSIARLHSWDVAHSLHFPTPIPAPHPLVVTLHDLTPLIFPDVMPSATKRLIYRAMNARACKVADRITTPSAHTARDLERMFPRSAGKIVPIPHAAELIVQGDVGTVPNDVGGWLDGAPFVFSMGNTKPNKGLDVLLAAFADVVGERPDVRLLLAGGGDPGWLVAHTTAATRGKVRFTGRIGDDELRALYAAAAVFAFPSRYEGFGLPPLEAMAFRTPTVVSQAASLPEVVGDASLLVAPEDPKALAAGILRVLGDTALRETLVTRGSERFRTFTYARTVEATVGIYRELAEGA